MDLNEIFEQNHHKLQLLDSDLAEKVKQLPQENAFQLCKTLQGEWNLKVGDNFFLHSQEGAKIEAENWADSLDLSQTEALYVFGIGLGYYFEPLQSWLQEKNHYLIFLEPDLAVLQQFLYTPLAEKILNHPRVYIRHLPLQTANTSNPHDIIISPEFMENLCLYFALTRPYVSSLTSYLKLSTPLFQKLQEMIYIESILSNEWVADLSNFNQDFVNNALNNFLLISDSYDLSQIAGKFHNIPAIICGAGPSLNKNFPLLKQLSSKALIIAGSSALNALTQKSFEPHLGVYLDPYERVYDRFMCNYGFEIPTFFSPRPHYDLVKTFQGPKVFVKSSANPLSEWIQQELDLPGQAIKEGISVSCFATQIAVALGCNPIIYVGLDLAYTNQQFYATGVASENAVSQNTLGITRNSINKEDIFGNPIQTKPTWIYESQWLSHFAQNNLNTHFVNATEGGLGIDTVENLPLSKVVHEFLTQDLPLKEIVHNILIQAPYSKKISPKYCALLEKLSKSLNQCESIYEKLLKIDNPTDSSINRLENKLLKEPAYASLIFEAMISSSFLLKRFEYEMTCLSLQLPQNEILPLKKKLLRDKYQFALTGIKTYKKSLDRILSASKEMVK